MFIYIWPEEWDGSNRILRKFKEFHHRFLRLTFLGDNFGFVSLISKSEEILYYGRFLYIMNEGIRVAGRLFKFLVY